ncbi:MAG: ABC transporter ATP-binding protein/permease [Mycetocola sp.]
MALELRGVSRVFGTDTSTGITDVNLVVHEGEFVTIVGPSGAGKSTLLNVLGLLDTPTAGTYRACGVDISTLSEREKDRLRSDVFGFVFQQSFVLGDMSALHNASLGLRVQRIPLAERSERAMAALTQLRMRSRAQAPGRVLSGGEQQRLALARAIATGPRIVLADEPTGNLDSANGAVVLSYLHELHASGATVILITHDDAVASTAERRIHVDDGTISATGDARTPHRTIVSAAAGDDGRTQPRADVSDPHTGAPSLRRRATAVIDDVSDAINVVTTRLGRTLFLLLAFALGVGGLITSLGVSESASAQVSVRLAAAALDDVRVTVPGGSALLSDNDDRLAEWLAAARDVPHVTGAGFSAQVAGSSATITRFASDPASRDESLTLMSASSGYLTLSGAAAVGPSTLSVLDAADVHGIAVVGQGAAEALGLSPPGPGSQVWINGRAVDVIGMFEAGERQRDLTNAVVVSPDVISGAAEVTTTLLVRTEPGYPAAVAEAIPAQLDPANPGQFGVETVADLRALRYGVASDLGALIAIVAGVLLTFAAISTATTMYISVQARTHEIALRRAIGASRADIGRLFVAEGFTIGVVGGAVGAAAGTVATLIVASGQGWTPVLDPWLPPAGLGIGMLTGLVSSFVPAVVASRLRPAHALRAR